MGGPSMRMTKLRSALVSIILAGLAMAGTVPSAGAVSVKPAADLQAAAPTPSPVVDGQACPDVMVIGARGTNDGPTTNPNSLPAYAKDQYHGVGATIYSMYGQLVTANPKLIFSLEPAVYPTIFGVKGLSTFLQNVGQSAQYLGDAQTGANSIAQEIRDTDTACGPHVDYILAGYSLGAWAVHDALELLPDKLGEIIGGASFRQVSISPNLRLNRIVLGESGCSGAFLALLMAIDPGQRSGGDAPGTRPGWGPVAGSAGSGAVSGMMGGNHSRQASGGTAVAVRFSVTIRQVREDGSEAPLDGELAAAL